VPLRAAVRAAVKVAAAAGAVPKAGVVRAGLLSVTAAAQVDLAQLPPLVCRHGREPVTGKTAPAVRAPPIAKNAPALPAGEGAPLLPALIAVVDDCNAQLIDDGSLPASARFHMALPFMAPIPDHNKTSSMTPKIP
jgi:hypothetical protein